VARAEPGVVPRVIPAIVRHAAVAAECGEGGKGGDGAGARLSGNGPRRVRHVSTLGGSCFVWQIARRADETATPPFHHLCPMQRNYNNFALRLPAHIQPSSSHNLSSFRPTSMTTSPSDDLITGHGAGWRAGFLAGERAAIRRASEGGGGGGGGSNAPGSPLFGRLLVEYPALFEAEVLSRLSPTDRAVLAQVDRAARDAVRLSADIACAGRTVGVKLKLVDFVQSAGRLAWAQANGCPWETRTCALVAFGGHVEALQWAREQGCPWDTKKCERAAEGGHLEVLQWAWEHGAPWQTASSQNSWNSQPCLNAAAYNGHVNVVDWLIAKAADVNYRYDGYVLPAISALHAAASRGHMDVVSQLIDAGVDVTAPDRIDMGGTPLDTAARLIMVWRCGLTVSEPLFSRAMQLIVANPLFKAPAVSAHEARISDTAFNVCFKF